MIQNNKENTKGQVGIGTLIVFISLVLVAAIASSVLLGSADLLQERGEQTSEESTDEVSDRVVTQTMFANATSGQVDSLRVPVRKASGSEAIDLEQATVEYLNEEDGNQYTLQYDSSIKHDTTGSGFGVVDATGSVSGAVLDEDGDRADILLNLDATSANDIPDQLGEGDEIQLVVVTSSGSETTVRATMPNQMSGDQVYEVG